MGSAVIAIGGGGIQPMRARSEQALQRWDAEKPNLQQQANGAGARISQRAEELKTTTQQEMATNRNGGGAG